jgi:hypothetical protein
LPSVSILNPLGKYNEHPDYTSIMEGHGGKKKKAVSAVELTGHRKVKRMYPMKIENY